VWSLLWQIYTILNHWGISITMCDAWGVAISKELAAPSLVVGYQGTPLLSLHFGSLPGCSSMLQMHPCCSHWPIIPVHCWETNLCQQSMISETVEIVVARLDLVQWCAPTIGKLQEGGLPGLKRQHHDDILAKMKICLRILAKGKKAFSSFLLYIKEAIEFKLGVH
jgi:hypothetical protein